MSARAVRKRRTGRLSSLKALETSWRAPREGAKARDGRRESRWDGALPLVDVSGFGEGAPKGKPKEEPISEAEDGVALPLVMLTPN